VEEGVGVFERLLMYDLTRRALEQLPAEKKEKEKPEDPAQALLQIIQQNLALLFKRIDLDGAARSSTEGEKEAAAGATVQRRGFGLRRLRLLEFVERLLLHFLSANVAPEVCSGFLDALQSFNFWRLLLVRAGLPNFFFKI
jgi:hypothetical protein